MWRIVALLLEVVPATLVAPAVVAVMAADCPKPTDLHDGSDGSRARRGRS